MLPLDHIPFYDENPSLLAEGFEALGFRASPPGLYTAPDHPGARWPSHSVFLRSGWFDLLTDADARAPGRPAACLFRTPSIREALLQLADLKPHAPVRLERRWRDDIGRPPETFTYASLAKRVAPVGVAVIEHQWPCTDILPHWFEHPNSAQAVLGLIFSGRAPGPGARVAGRFLDIAAFEYWTRAAFSTAFPGVRSGCAVRVQVADLAAVRAAQQARGARVSEAAAGLCVRPPPGLDCGFLFCSAPAGPTGPS